VISRDHSVAAPYLDDLDREASAVGEALGGPRPSAQLAIGGGTPTYLSPDELARLCDIVDGAFPPAVGAERSIEVDPRVTTREQLALLAERGFNRISLGVQDLAPVVQRAINRIQSLEQTRAITECAREQGFGSVNFDLIYGLPYQTPGSFDETVRAVLALRPDRIALYSYAHVTWVSKQQRGFERKDLPGAEAKLDIFITAIRRLTEAGYVFLGMDHFALPEDEMARAADDGTLGRNFMGYTTQRADALVGLGASAISELSDAYVQNARSPEDWSEALGGRGLATLRGWWLTDDDRRRRWLILDLMCRGRIDPGSYAERFGEPLDDRVGDLRARLAGFAADGLLEPEGGGWRVTSLGRLFLRPMAMTFDAHLDAAGPGAGPGPRYSRTV
jgi:oxygen-independent coproporphyrinogen-3 oxidase